MCNINNHSYTLHFPGKCKDKYKEYIQEHSEDIFAVADNIIIISVITKECIESSPIYRQCKKSDILSYNPLKNRYVMWHRYDKAKYILESLNDIIEFNNCKHTEVSDYEYALIVDGNDVIINRDLDKSLVDVLGDNDIIFNPTCYNYPKVAIDSLSNRNNLGVYKYINAGVCFGHINKLKVFYDKVVEFINKDFKHYDSEQYYIRKAFDYFNHTKELKVTFDNTNEYLTCMHLQ